DPRAVPTAAPARLFPYTTLFRSPGATMTVTRIPASALKTRVPRPARNRPVAVVFWAGIGLRIRDRFRSEPEWTPDDARLGIPHRSEEHTSELQSRENLVCRLLLE